MSRVVVIRTGARIAGLLIVASALVVTVGVPTIATAAPKSHTSLPQISAFPTLRQVTTQVAAAEVTPLRPSSIQPPLSTLAAYGDFGYQNAGPCVPPATNTSTVDVASCTFGDKSSSKTIVLTGDSRAQMWFDTFVTIARGAKLKLVFLAKSGCPSPLATYRINNNGTLLSAPWAACTKWHRFVTRTIDRLKPRAVVVSSWSDLALAHPVHYAQYTEINKDMRALLKSIPSQTKAIVLGNFPEPGAASPTLCLSKALTPLLACSYTPSQAVTTNNLAVKNAAATDHAAFISQLHWLCASTCPAIIDGIVPYTIDGYNIDNTYTQHLTGVLWSALKPYIR